MIRCCGVDLPIGHGKELTVAVYCMVSLKYSPHMGNINSLTHQVAIGRVLLRNYSHYRYEPPT